MDIKLNDKLWTSMLCSKLYCIMQKCNTVNCTYQGPPSPPNALIEPVRLIVCLVSEMSLSQGLLVYKTNGLDRSGSREES